MPWTEEAEAPVNVIERNEQV